MTVEEEKELFYTNGGRIVYGGGGIIPDIEVPGETWKPVEINLERKSMFFDFAVKYVAAHPDLRADFEVTSQMGDEFKRFIAEKDFTYKSALQVAYEELKQTVTDEDKEESFRKSLDELAALIEDQKAADLERSMDYIKRAIKREIVRGVAGETGFYEEIVLKSDKTVKAAVELLTNSKEYTRLITEGKAKAQL
jgi:carboxyl-terminal processing protease